MQPVKPHVLSRRDSYNFRPRSNNVASKRASRALALPTKFLTKVAAASRLAEHRLSAISISTRSVTGVIELPSSEGPSSTCNNDIRLLTPPVVPPLDGVLMRPGHPSPT